MRNYKEIITKAKDYPQLKYDIKEIEDMKAKGYNVKNNIEEVKKKLNLLIEKEWIKNN